MAEQIECPWCYHKVILIDSICPECKHEVLDEHLQPTLLDDEQLSTAEATVDLTVTEAISNHFKCTRCKHEGCHIEEVAMTGTGLSKLLDIQHHHYLFVSCSNCGFVEVFDPDVLHGKSVGKLGSIMDLLFGS